MKSSLCSLKMYTQCVHLHEVLFMQNVCLFVCMHVWMCVFYYTSQLSLKPLQGFLCCLAAKSFYLMPLVSNYANHRGDRDYPRCLLQTFTHICKPCLQMHANSIRHYSHHSVTGETVSLKCWGLIGWCAFRIRTCHCLIPPGCQSPCSWNQLMLLLPFAKCETQTKWWISIKWRL